MKGKSTNNGGIVINGGGLISRWGGTPFTQMGESNFSGSNGEGQTSDGVDSPPHPPHTDKP